jgi:uncharacterized protein (TIGR03437 family)
MCGVSLRVTVNGVSTFPIFFGVYYGQQINAVLPSNTPTGTGTITATYQNQTSATYPIQVTDAAFGSFTTNGYGFGQASVTDVNYVLNTIIHPLHPGDVGILWGTGLGAISASDAITPPFGNVGSPTVYVGNTALAPVTQLLYAGRSPSSPGLDQINFTVPPGVNGCNVPIAVQASGVVGNVGTIAVAPAGQNTCSDSVMGQALVNKLAAGNTVNFGYLRMERSANTLITFGNSLSERQGDQAFASFSTFSPQTAFLAAYGVSSGYCVTNQNGTGYISDATAAATLDAGGALNLRSFYSSAAANQSANLPGYYAAQLSYASGGWILNGYNYTASGTGGGDVGAFSATLATPATINGLAKFTGIDTEQDILRNGDYTVQWTGGDASLQNGNVTIAGFSAGTTFFSAFQCTAPAAAQSFTIPGWILSTLPASEAYPINNVTVPIAYIWIGQYGNPVEFTATGLDRGIFDYAFYFGYLVDFK